MKKITKLLIALFFIFIVTGCNSNEHLTEISYNEYHKLLDNKESFAIEIMRTDCSACIKYKPILKQVLDDYNISIKYINTDHLSEEEYKKLFDETGVTGTPTILFYKNGEEETVASRAIGSITYEKTVAKFKANGLIEE